MVLVLKSYAPIWVHMTHFNITLAPSSENLVVMALPKPVPPPVIKTTLSLKVPAGSMVALLALKWADCKVETMVKLDFNVDE